MEPTEVQALRPGPRLKWIVDELKRISYTEAGRQMGRSHSAVLKWANEKVPPDPVSRRVIEIWTGGDEQPPPFYVIRKEEWEPESEREQYEHVQPLSAEPATGEPIPSCT